MCYSVDKCKPNKHYFDDKCKPDKHFCGDKCKTPSLFGCQTFKLLKVIGEKVVQVVSDTTDELDYPACEILEVTFELINTTDHAFTDKVIKQGTIRKRILFCDTSGIIRCQFIDIPFTAVAEIPGVDPCLELEFQNKLILAETDFILCNERILNEKIVFEIKIKVSTWVQERLWVCKSNILSHMQVCR